MSVTEANIQAMAKAARLIVTITQACQLTDAQARHFAEFLKRTGFSDFRSKARDDAEAYAMQEAANQVAEALREAGYAPR
jgi:hypothetical protein